MALGEGPHNPTDRILPPPGLACCPRGGWNELKRTIENISLFYFLLAEIDKCQRLIEKFGETSQAADCFSGDILIIVVRDDTDSGRGYKYQTDPPWSSSQYYVKPGPTDNNLDWLPQNF